MAVELRLKGQTLTGVAAIKVRLQMVLDHPAQVDATIQTMLLYPLTRLWELKRMEGLRFAESLEAAGLLQMHKEGPHWKVAIDFDKVRRVLADPNLVLPEPKKRRARNDLGGRLPGYTRSVRLEVLMHYGGRCSCGETNPGVLTVYCTGWSAESIRGKAIHGVFFWLRARAYPDGWAVTCYNCKRLFGRRQVPSPYGHKPEPKAAPSGQSEPGLQALEASGTQDAPKTV
jgi:hypothetical protein